MLVHRPGEHLPGASDLPPRRQVFKTGLLSFSNTQKVDFTSIGHTDAVRHMMVKAVDAVRNRHNMDRAS